MLLTALGACSSRPDLRTLDAAPKDFTLDVTVYPATGRARADASDAGRLPARIILEPGGGLRAAAGAVVSDRTVPPQSRLLSPEEVDRAWRLVRESGLLDPDSAARIAGPREFSPRADAPSALVCISAAGTRDFYRVALVGASPEAAAMQRLISRLGSLAYLSGQPLP